MLFRSCIHKHTHTSTCIHTHTHAYTHTNKCIHKYTHTHTNTHSHKHKHVNTNTRTHTHAHSHTHMHAHTCIHTHTNPTHIHTLFSPVAPQSQTREVGRHCALCLIDRCYLSCPPRRHQCGDIITALLIEVKANTQHTKHGSVCLPVRLMIRHS